MSAILRFLSNVFNFIMSHSDVTAIGNICTPTPTNGNAGIGNIFDIIRELQSDGFKIAMDDFGSGYSSLNMLKEMPLDIIKMDLRFLDGEEKKSQVILKALIEMAQTMDLNVVVEGVESIEQVEFLRQFENCCLQGFFYSRPVTTDIFESMLKQS